MPLASLQGLGRRPLGLPSILFAPPTAGASVGMPVDVRRLEHRLAAARERATPGFMTLHAVRSGGNVVDFDWDFASLAAARLLCCDQPDLPDLRGRHLIDVLAGRAGRVAVFNQYSRVVEFGVARPVRQAVVGNGSVDVVRHGAVRFGDGVAVYIARYLILRIKSVIAPFVLPSKFLSMLLSSQTTPAKSSGRK